MQDIKSLAKQWLDLDRDAETRNEISNLLANGDYQELELRLRTRIAFGTAGLRARMEAGFARMNSLTVIQASQGLADYVMEQATDAKQRGIVIGRDARHNSEKFAKLAAAAFVAKGIKVLWLEETVHTPLVPFTVGMLGAIAGIMVTASHNPSYDNGYKVYWSNACQIIPPHDVGIAEAIEKNTVPLSWDVDAVHRNDNTVKCVLERAKAAYYQTVLKTIKARFQWPDFVYTPMHGVGYKYLSETIEQIFMENKSLQPTQIHPDTSSKGFLGSIWYSVPEQTAHNPDFPTVKFPNPEEKGALNMAQRLAESLWDSQTARRMPLIIATDPDADRLAVAEYIDGKWHQFTGNQVGILLAHFVLSNQSPQDLPRLSMLCSTVSSGMLSAMAKKEGFFFQETLTGFKWLGNVAQNLMLQDCYNVPFAFEEAIGYMFTDVVFDKDGICAAANFLQAAAKWWKEESLTPFSKLQELYKVYGCFADANTYLISPSSTVNKNVFDAIRVSNSKNDQDPDQGCPYPSHLGKYKIVEWRDLTKPHQYDSTTDSKVPSLPVSNDQMITCTVEGDVRFTIRASGTEPKIKLYVEGRAPTENEAKARALVIQQALIDEWFTPPKWGLSLPA